MIAHWRWKAVTLGFATAVALALVATACDELWFAVPWSGFAQKAATRAVHFMAGWLGAMCWDMWTDWLRVRELVAAHRE